MLVLSRRKNETICIGDDIEVTVVDVRGDKVRLGIDAPRSVVVHRKEILLKILAEQEAASGTGSAAATETGCGQIIEAQNNATSDQFPHTMIHEDRRAAG